MDIANPPLYSRTAKPQKNIPYNVNPLNVANRVSKQPFPKLVINKLTRLDTAISLPHKKLYSYSNQPTGTNDFSYISSSPVLWKRCLILITDNTKIWSLWRWSKCGRKGRKSPDSILGPIIIMGLDEEDSSKGCYYMKGPSCSTFSTFCLNVTLYGCLRLFRVASLLRDNSLHLSIT